MPLNLAESALSVAKLGENSLAAMYLGEERIYPNVVTVSLDGGQSQTGTPGQPMTAFTWSISSTNTASYGFTTANEAAATLTGLPAGWVATYANIVAPQNVSTTGTWTITTTDGKFPTTGVNILTSSLTRNNPETGWGTLLVTYNATGQFTGWNGNYSATGFVGDVVSISLEAPVTSGNAGVGNTTLGKIIGPTTFNGQTISTTVAGGSASMYANTSNGAWPAECGISTSTSVTMGAIGTVSGTTTYFMSSVRNSQVDAQVISAGVNSPPWAGGTSSGPQMYANTWPYNGNSTPIDNRVSYRVKIDGTCSGSCSYSFPYYWTGMMRDASSTGSPGSGWSSYSVSGSGAGTYTISIESTRGSVPENVVYSAAAQGYSSYSPGPVTSNMT